MRRALLLALLLALSTLLIGSRFYPEVTRIEVYGNEYYDKEDILELAHVQLGDPFLWVTKKRVDELLDNPWIRQVRILKHWPNTIALTVEERQAAIIYGATVYALDGTVLPNAPQTETLIRLKGWGEDRSDEAMELLRLLAQFEPEVISYSPSGFDIRLANGRLYTPSADALKQQWGAFLSQQGSFVAVYPWGVSVQP